LLVALHEVTSADVANAIAAPQSDRDVKELARLDHGMHVVGRWPARPVRLNAAKHVEADYRALAGSAIAVEHLKPTSERAPEWQLRRLARESASAVRVHEREAALGVGSDVLQRLLAHEHVAIADEVVVRRFDVVNVDVFGGQLGRALIRSQLIDAR